MATEAHCWEDRFGGYTKDGTTQIKPRKDHDQIWREPFKRDVDRLKYTRELRRLKDVAQVARTGESYLHHDRLSHSIKVSQVGRNLAEILLRLFLLRRKPGWDMKSNIREKSYRLARREGYRQIPPGLHRQLDPDAVEAACLAHDIGHPPFGHLAERTLDELLYEKTNPEYNCESDQTPDEIDAQRVKNDQELKGLRFEGNAQAFRILTRLTAHRFANTGLGLTVSTLNGILKYPYGRGEGKDDGYEDRNSKKFGYYETEKKAFNSVASHFHGKRERNLTAQIVDYADDVTYAVHDLTDFYKYGQIPLDRLLREARGKEKWGGFTDQEISGFKDYLIEDHDPTTLDKLNELFVLDKLLEYLSNLVGDIAKPLLKPYEGSSKQRVALDAFTAELVEYFIDNNHNQYKKARNVDLAKESNEYHLKVNKERKDRIDILQKLSKYYVHNNTNLVQQECGQEKVIRELFEKLYEKTAGDCRGNSVIPDPYATWLDTNDSVVGTFEDDSHRRARIVTDFIAAMTEPQAVDMHRRLTGDTPGSLQNFIIR